MGYRLGIDVGTTNTVAAVAVDGAPAAMVTLSDGLPELPSLVFVTDDGQLLVGSDAARAAEADPSRAIQDPRGQLGFDGPLPAGSAEVTAAEATAAVLLHVFARVTAERGGSPDETVLSYPTRWTEDEIDRFDQAIAVVGLGAVRMCSEAEAAAATYHPPDTLPIGSRVLLYDLGGGSCHVAVLAKSPAGLDVVGIGEGAAHPSGADFDEAVVRFVLGGMGERGRELQGTDPESRVRLAAVRRACSRAREMLSFELEVEVSVTLPGYATKVRLRRTELDSLVRPGLRDSLAMVTRALRAAGAVPADVAAILLVGGCCRMPIVSAVLGQEFDVPIALGRHPEHDLAVGALLVEGPPGISPTSVEQPAPEHSEAQKSAQPQAEPIPVPAPAAPATRDIVPVSTSDDTPATQSVAASPVTSEEPPVISTLTAPPSPQPDEDDEPTAPIPTVTPPPPLAAPVAPATSSPPARPPTMVYAATAVATAAAPSPGSDAPTQLLGGDGDRWESEPYLTGQPTPGYAAQSPAQQPPGQFPPGQRPPGGSRPRPAGGQPTRPTQPYGAGGAGGSGGYPPGSGSSGSGPFGSRRRLILIIAGIVVLVAAAVGVGVWLLRSGSSPVAAPNPPVVLPSAPSSASAPPTASPSAPASPSPSGSPSGSPDSPSSGPTATPSAPAPALPTAAAISQSVVVVPMRRNGERDRPLYLVDTEGKLDRVELRVPPGSNVNPMMQATRDTIIYLNAGVLRVMASDGSGDRALFNRDPGGCETVAHASWSLRKPNEMVIGCRVSKSRQTLLIVGLDGRLIRRLDIGDQRIGDISVSPDGETVLYWASDEAGTDGGALFTLPMIGTGAPKQLTDSGCRGGCRPGVVPGPVPNRLPANRRRRQSGRLRDERRRIWGAGGRRHPSGRLQAILVARRQELADYLQPEVRGGRARQDLRLVADPDQRPGGADSSRTGGRQHRQAVLDHALALGVSQERRAVAPEAAEGGTTPRSSHIRACSRRATAAAL